MSIASIVAGRLLWVAMLVAPVLIAGLTACSEPHRNFISMAHLAELTSGNTCIDSSGNKGESCGNSSYYPLGGKAAILVGIVLSCFCWWFVYFRFNPERWAWQFPILVLLLIAAFLFIAYGVYAITDFYHRKGDAHESIERRVRARERKFVADAIRRGEGV